MGRVRNKTVKRAARQLIEKYFARMATDFHTNKRVADDCAIIQSKRLRNKIAGFATHLMRRIEKGPVRGISLKLQEEEREKKLDFAPEVSFVAVEEINVDPKTYEMLQELELVDLKNIKKHD